MVAAKKEKAPKFAAPAEFPAVLAHLVAVVNGGGVGDMDFEMYESFNEQYKPSDWTRNPVSDERIWSFGMDGTGSQVAIWYHSDGATVEESAVVMLGSEGEAAPLATDLPSFIYLVASGVGPWSALSGEVTGEEAANSELLAWVETQWPNRAFPKPSEIIDAARDQLGHFEAHIRGQSMH